MSDESYSDSDLVCKRRGKWEMNIKKRNERNGSKKTMEKLTKSKR